MNLLAVAPGAVTEHRISSGRQGVVIIASKSSDGRSKSLGDGLVAGTTTLKARAWVPDPAPSVVASASYTLRPAARTVTPGTGTYVGAQAVTPAGQTAVPFESPDRAPRPARGRHGRPAVRGRRLAKPTSDPPVAKRAALLRARP